MCQVDVILEMLYRILELTILNFMVLMVNFLSNYIIKLGVSYPVSSKELWASMDTIYVEVDGNPAVDYSLEVCALVEVLD